MSKQLRIWIFTLLGTLLATSSLLAEGVITVSYTHLLIWQNETSHLAEYDVSFFSLSKTTFLDLLCSPALSDYRYTCLLYTSRCV